MAEHMNRTTEEKAKSFSCPSCGGRMLFDPETQKLKCPYCETLKDVDLSRYTPKEYDIHSAPAADAEDEWGDTTRVMRCKGCGAEIVLTGETSADRCAFCGAPHVMENQSKAGIAPESVLPFGVTQKQAAQGFKKWIGKKLFAPSKAKKMAALGEIAGVYLPHWTYDAESVSRYVGQEGHYYYVEVPVKVTENGRTRTEMRRERRTDWRPTSGVVAHSFDDILINGSHRLPDDLLSRVRPYDLSRLARYAPAFLSGFASEKPAVDVQEGWKNAQNVIDERMRSLARQDILSHADEARVSSVQTTNSQVKYKLMLLPMYLSSFKFKNKAYHVLVNGQTGRVGGQAPVSPLRVLLAVLLGLAVMAGLYLLFTGGDSGSEFYHYMSGLLRQLL